jgi:hypothetical protein
MRLGGHADCGGSCGAVDCCTYPASEPMTLELFMEDYVVHLEYHVRQILQSADSR